MAVPILGLLQTNNHMNMKEIYNDNYSNNMISEKENMEKSNIKDQVNIVPGRIVVYGDSNCIDDSHLQKRMFFFFYKILNLYNNCISSIFQCK